jgi:sec-independent protein translocase protein TatC
MWLLFEVAVVVCRIMDRRRDRLIGTTLADDEPTPIEQLDKIGRIDDDIT